MVRQISENKYLVNVHVRNRRVQQVVHGDNGTATAREADLKKDLAAREIERLKNIRTLGDLLAVGKFL